MAAQKVHPALGALQDYEALQGRSNAHYDALDSAMRDDPGYGGYNNTMDLIANQQNKQSPWAPYFQSLSEQGVTGLAQDTGRGHGIADTPGYFGSKTGALADTGQHIAAQPLMASTNLAGPVAPTSRTRALEGLEQAGPQAAIYDPNELSSILAQYQPQPQKPAGK